MKRNILALGRLKTGETTQTEKAYEGHLKLRLMAGEVEIHEVKGFWMDDARVKIKVASEMFPFRFVAVTRKAGRWEAEEF